MDLEDLKNAMKFFNWEMIVAVAILTSAWVQLLKRYLPEEKVVGSFRIPIVVIVAFVSGFIFAHLMFDISGAKHTESIALFHGFCGTLFSLLGYEMLKGTKLGLRSTNELKK